MGSVAMVWPLPQTSLEWPCRATSKGQRKRIHRIVYTDASSDLGFDVHLLPMSFSKALFSSVWSRSSNSPTTFIRQIRIAIGTIASGRENNS